MADNIKYNYGLMILKLWMSLEVVLVHTWGYMGIANPVIESFFYSFMAIAVPVFVFISFFLTSDSIYNGNKSYLVKRMKRLLVPYVLWFLIYLVFYIIMTVLNNWDILSIRSCVLQFFTGNVLTYNSPMWYILDVAIIYILLGIVGLCAKKHKDTVYCVLFLLGMIFFYSGVNYSVFSKTIFEVKYSYGRIFELLPVAVAGLFIGKYRLLDRLKSHWLITSISCFLIVYIWKRTGFVSIKQNFGYGGFCLCCISILLVTGFYVLPLDRLPDVLLKILRRITSYSMGIFSIHIMISNLINEYLFPAGDLYFSLIVFICSLIICIILGAIPKINMKYLIE